MRLNTVKYLTTLVFIVGALQVNTVLAQMDHGEMQMQGGKAPADARDPHAYSDGYTLTEGPYAQPGPRQLKLADEHAFWSVLGDRLEYHEDSESTVYDIQAWYGTTYNRFVIKAEGDIADGTLEESSTELLWGHALNAYFDTMAAPLTDHGGEILKFIGDAMLAIFPMAEPRACQRALRAALEAQEGMARLNEERRAVGQAELGFGLALHVGDVMWGNIGAQERLDFTVIGPAVNVATRLEELSKELRRPLLVSGDFAGACACAGWSTRFTS